MSLPPPLEIETGDAPKRSVIWLHGLGADGHDFEPIVPELRLRGDAVRFVFPHAPERPVTINGGMVMRAWYDITSFDRDAPQDETGIGESATLVARLVERERQRGSDYGRIVVAGFSQGGAVALHAALGSGRRLAGVMALSSYLPMAGAYPPGADPRPSQGLPVFMAHGVYDPVLPVDLGRASRDVLEAAGYPVEWHEYPMAHAVSPPEIADIGRWLAARLA